MSIEREYEIVLRPEPEGGFGVFVPELPSVATQGETIEEAIEAYREVMHEDGLPLPTGLPQQRRRTRGVSAKLPDGRCKQGHRRPRTVVETRRVPYMRSPP
jgi:predicted RNase H-like HicB family nuclease